MEVFSEKGGNKPAGWGRILLWTGPPAFSPHPGGKDESRLAVFLILTFVKAIFNPPENSGCVSIPLQTAISVKNPQLQERKARHRFLLVHVDGQAGVFYFFGHDLLVFILFQGPVTLAGFDVFNY